MQLEIKAALSVSETGAISGIAWPFGSADRVGDMIEKGAFGASETLPMLFEHDRKQPIGVWHSVSETTKGLEVHGQLLIDGVQRAREVHALVKAGGLTGLSIGFQTTKSAPRVPRGRTIKSLALHEISLVAVPCHPGARVNSVKSHVANAIVDTLNRATATYRKQ
jgi:HK97 family phage prohead protease